MDPELADTINDQIIKLLKNNATSKNIKKKLTLHESKVHFIPIRYRVFHGLLQSLNIKFGNFIEVLLRLVVEHDACVELLPESGAKLPLQVTAETNELIDRYMTERRLPDSPVECDAQFQHLLEAIVALESAQPTDSKQMIRRDVDLLFRVQSSGAMVYAEVKYNDDHDTGKFVDINRKFLKTYAGLVDYLGVSDVASFTPVLYYFNPTVRYGPIFTPSSHIYRGAELFDEFFETKYVDVDEYLRSIGNDEEILAAFDELYKQVRYPPGQGKLFP